MSATTESRPATSAALKSSAAAYLQVEGALKAADFYQRAFGAKLAFAYPPDDKGTTMRVHSCINDCSVMLGNPYPERGSPLEKPEGFNIMLPVDAIDSRFQRAIDAGAKVVMPVDNMFWGDRSGQLHDPFGVVRAINQGVKCQPAG